MTVRQLERNLTALLGLAVIAGMEDERCEQLGGYAVAFLGLMERAGGLGELVRQAEAEQRREEG